MENTTTAVAPMQQIKTFLEGDKIKAKFAELLGQRASGFITGVLQTVNNNKLLQKASPATIYNAAATAAILDLPINNSLGFAYIVPYGSDAQFQIGYKGLIQLAQRTGQYKAINATAVYANQFKSFNSLTEELDADFTLDGTGEVIGYAAYFKLVNGFEKTVYWSMDKVKSHGKRFSKTFTNGPWKTDFDSMAMKTVLKQALTKFGPMSIEMQRAVVADQAIVRDVETNEVEYVDHTDITNEAPDLSAEFKEAVEAAKDANALDAIEITYTEAQTDAGKKLLAVRFNELMNQ